jgi:hypothetical protein
MDEDVEKRLSDLEKHLSAADKRFDDWKGYIAGGATLITIWFAVLTIVLSWNYSSEKASLRDFQRDLREDLGKSVPTPELELQSADGRPLAGQEIIADFNLTENNVYRVGFHHILKNAGHESTGPMWAKFYSKTPLELPDKSTDEPQYEFEGIASAKNLDPNDIPGQLSAPWQLWWDLSQKKWPSAGRYQCLLKIYYGHGKVVPAPITLIVLQEKIPK